MFVCAGSFETFPFATPVGIGLVETAIRLTRLCETQRPDELVFVGTAGTYGAHEIWDICESRTAAHIELAALKGEAYTPLKPVVGWDGQRFWRKRVDEVSRETLPERGEGKKTDVSRETIVNSSEYITTDTSVWNAMQAQGVTLENMEFYAVLSVAERYGIPAKGIFVVTNRCDANAHRDFTAHHDEAMARLTSYVITRYPETKERR